MDGEFLSTHGRILVVKDPKSLPNADHAAAVSALCRAAALVLLFSFGDSQYQFPPGYELPENAKLIEYDYETLDASVAQVSEAFAAHGVSFYSRHATKDPIPFVLTGGVISLPAGTQLEFFDSAKSRTSKITLNESQSGWQI